MKKMAAVGSLSILVAFCAMAGDGDRNRNQNDSGNNGNGRLEATLVGSVPSTTIGGITSGGAPWVVRSSEVSISPAGQLEMDVQGLLISSGPATGTVGPVKMVAASLVCGGSGGSVAASSDGAPLSTTGNAHIEAQLTLPATCMAPVVLVRIFNATAATGSQLGPFIAVSGMSLSSSQQNEERENDR